MKVGLLPQASNNVLDQRMDTSFFAPHRNPMANAALNAARNNAVQSQMQLDAARGAKIPPTSAFAQMLKDMPKGAAQDKQALRNAAKSGQNPWIPIPTPRPDPNEKQPTVFRPSDNGKG